MMKTMTSLLSRASRLRSPWARCSARARRWPSTTCPAAPPCASSNLHPPVTRIAEQQSWLHWFMLIVCVVIFVGVFGVMFYSILKHRKSVGHKAANFHESVAVEIAWTVVPLLIVIAMGAMATRTVVAMKDTSNADLTIKATGYQWKWGYDYLKGEGEGIAFLSTLDLAHREMSNAASPRATTTCSRSTTRWSCRWTRRSASSPPPTTSSTPGWCRRSASSRTPFPASCATPGSAPRRPATSTASAPSCAARNTPTCRSTSRW